LSAENTTTELRFIRDGCIECKHVTKLFYHHPRSASINENSLERFLFLIQCVRNNETGRISSFRRLCLAPQNNYVKQETSTQNTFIPFTVHEILPKKPRTDEQKIILEKQKLNSPSVVEYPGLIWRSFVSFWKEVFKRDDACLQCGKRNQFTSTFPTTNFSLLDRFLFVVLGTSVRRNLRKNICSVPTFNKNTLPENLPKNSSFRVNSTTKTKNVTLVLGKPLVVTSSPIKEDMVKIMVESVEEKPKDKLKATEGGWFGSLYNRFFVNEVTTKSKSGEFKTADKPWHQFFFNMLRPKCVNPYYNRVQQYGSFVEEQTDTKPVMQEFFVNQDITVEPEKILPSQILPEEEIFVNLPGDKQQTIIDPEPIISNQVTPEEEIFLPDIPGNKEEVIVDQEPILTNQLTPDIPADKKTKVMEKAWRKIDSLWYIWFFSTFKLQSRNLHYNALYKSTENKTLPVFVEGVIPIFVDFHIPDQPKKLLALRPKMLIERWHRRYYGGLFVPFLYLKFFFLFYKKTFCKD